MTETTELPGVGKVKTVYVYAGLALVAGIAGYAYWRRSQGGDGLVSVDGTDGGLYVDTRTGSDLPSDSYTNPAPSNADGQSGTGIGGDSAWKAPATDQEWSAQVIERLSWYEPAYVSAIVAKYLSRQPISSTEANVIREGWAQVGQPPGRQNIITATTPAQTSTPTMTAPKSLKATGTSTSSISVDWAPVAGAKGYKVLVNGKQNGNSVLYSNGVARYLKAGTRYSIGVAGIFAGDKTGPVATITVTTKKK